MKLCWIIYPSVSSSQIKLRGNKTLLFLSGKLHKHRKHGKFLHEVEPNTSSLKITDQKNLNFFNNKKMQILWYTKIFECIGTPNH